MSFSRLRSDASFYLYPSGGVRIEIPVYVDDITISAPTDAEADKVVAELAEHFELRDLGDTSFLLGIEITRNCSKHSLSLSQRQYIIDMLEDYRFTGCTPVQTPMEPGLHLTKDKNEQERAEMMSKVPHIRDLFCYLKGTTDTKLTYSPDPASKSLFTVYTDADSGGDPDTGRSTGAYVVKMGTGAVDWSSKLQPIVTLSSTEAEYVAAVEAGKEICWMRNLLTELGYPVEGKPSVLHIDNNSAISVARNPEHFGRLKHLDLRFYWLRDIVQAGLIDPQFCPTAQMPADMLTKALPRPKVAEMRTLLGLQD